MVARIAPLTAQVGTPSALPTGGDPRALGPDRSLGDALIGAAGVIGGVVRERKDEQEASIATAYSARALADTQIAAMRELQRLKQEAGPGGSGVVDGMNTWLESTSAAAIEKAPNERARQYLRERFDAFRVTVNTSAFEYEVVERERWAVESYEEGTKSAAATSAAMPGQAAVFAAEQIAAIKADPNISEATRAELARDATETIAYAAVLGEREADPYVARRKIRQRLGLDPEATAEQTMLALESGEEILASVEADAGRQVPADRRQEAIIAYASGGTVSFLDDGSVKITRGSGMAASAGFAYDALPIPKLIDLLSGAEAEIARRENEAKQRKGQYDALVQQEVADTLTALQNGDSVPLVPREKLEAVYDPGRAIVIDTQQKVAQANAGILAKMDGMTNEELAAIVASPPTGSENREFAQRSYELRVQRAAEIARQRDADPGGYVLAESPPVREAYAAFAAAMEAEASGQGDAAASQVAQTNYLRASMTEQRRLGVREPKLPKQYLDAVAADFNEGMASRDPDLAAAKLAAAAVMLVDTPEALDQVGEAVGDLGRLAMDGVPGIVIKRLMGQQGVTDEQRRNIVATRGLTVSDVDDAIAAEFAPLVASLSPVMGGSEVSATYLQQGTLLAIDALASGRASDPAGAARLAYAELYADRFETVGSLRIPRQFDPAAVTSGLSAYIQRDVRNRLAIEPEAGLTPDETRARLARTLQINGRWVTNMAGDGAYLMFGGDAVKDDRGDVIEIKYSDAVKMVPRESDWARDVANDRYREGL